MAERRPQTPDSTLQALAPISPRPDADPAFDARTLFDEGLATVRHLARERWTDHNLHDPGITMLEPLTELAYRHTLPLEDLLAAPEGLAPQFHAPRAVLPNRPLTDLDWRKLLIDLEDVKNALEGLLKPEEKETILGEAEVMEVFKVTRVGTIAGCMVRSGIIPRTARVRLVRDGAIVYNGNISSLKRFKDDAKEVREGLECGIGIENFNDVKINDVFECYRTEEVARTLDQAAKS